MWVFDKAKDQFQDVEQADAQNGILSGAYLPQNKRTPMLAPDGKGEIYDTPPREIGKYLERGYTLASHDDVLRYGARNDEWLAAGLGFTDSRTFGLANAATQGLESIGFFEPGTADEYRAAREVNPKSYLAGAIAGSIGPGANPTAGFAAMAGRGGKALLSRGVARGGFAKEALEITGEGLTGAAKALHAAAFAPRIIEKGVRGVGSATLTRFGGGAATAAARQMDGLGRTGMAAMAPRLAAGAAVLGGEGAVYGAFDKMSEADFGNPDLAASQIVAAVGMGAFEGAAWGLAGGATFTMGKKVAGRMFEMATGGPAALNKMRISKYKEQAPDDLKGVIDDPERMKQVFNPKVRETADAELTAALTKSDAVMTQATTGLDMPLRVKRGDMSTSQASYVRAKNASDLLEEDLKTAAQEMTGEWARGVKTIQKEFRDTAGDYRQRLSALQKADVDLLALKNRAGKLGPDVKQLKTLTMTTRGMLTDPQLWGKKAIAAMADAGNTRDNARAVTEATRGIFMPQRGTTAAMVDPAHMSEFIGGYSNKWQDTTGLQIKSQIDAMQSLGAQLRKNTQTSVSKAQISELKKAEAELSRVYNRMNLNLADHNRLREMDDAFKGSSLLSKFSELNITGLIKGNPIATAAYVGAVASNPMGAAAGFVGRSVLQKGVKVYQGVQNPVGFYMRKGQLEAERIASTSHMESGFKSVLKKGLKGASRLAAKPPPMTRRMHSGALSAMIAANTSEKRREAHQEAIDEMQAIASEPNIVGDRVAESLGLTAEEMPNISNAIALKVVKNAAWMLEHHIQPQGKSTLMGRTPGLSDFELQKFAQQLRIAQDPLTVVDLLTAGELTLADVQALQGMWPELYEQWHVALITQLSELEDPSAVDYSTRIQLGILFGIPVDPSMQFDQILKAQEANAMITLGGQSDGQQQGPTNGPALMSEGLQTRSAESIMQGATDSERTAQRRTA